MREWKQHVFRRVSRISAGIGPIFVSRVGKKIADAR